MQTDHTPKAPKARLCPAIIHKPTQEKFKEYSRVQDIDSAFKFPRSLSE